MQKINAVTLKQLRALRHVAAEGSISGAAAELGLTAPAVHTQIRNLEKALDCAILEQSGAFGARFTPEGQVMLEVETQISASLTNGLERIRSLQHGQSGLVVLGVVSTAKYFVPGLVAQINRAFPEIDVILKVGNRQEILRELNDSSLDLIIMGRPPRSPINIAYNIGPHPHVMVASSDNPLSHRRDIPAMDLLAETFLAREEGSGTRLLMTRYLDRIGEGVPYRMIEMGSNETIKQAVMADLGVAMISQHTVTEEIRSGRLVALDAPELPMTRQWYVLHREDLTISKTTETVLNFILAQNAAFLPRLD
ncbi:LysR family transcriptional regulator [Cohaesibacter sp. CAU 1516]|uniref:LysR family transcriptional regulator n=1 Tax=Cohaesibacter sp. CAU 1516 TaxID=2576038 RepID=UPI0010FE745C|nr:LysR family transcriptional regulator [Cohaesibacter sp. CAU 1516]TLP46188.1 LysR family transcriptional regulator [Cohaesibacter sp. CAU 1516]